MCHPSGGTYNINWGNNINSVRIGGNVIFEGDLTMDGLGWRQMGDQLTLPVGALVPSKLGVVEYEVREAAVCMCNAKT